MTTFRSQKHELSGYENTEHMGSVYVLGRLLRQNIVSAQLTLTIILLFRSLKRGDQERLIWLEPRNIDATDQVRAIVSTLFDEDERFVSMDDSGERLVERFGIAKYM